MPILIGQSVNRFNTCPTHRRCIHLAQIVVWILCSTILLKCFCSVLLNTYFRIKSHPFINTIDDLVAHPEVGLYTIQPNMHVYYPKIFNILQTKILTYANRMIDKALRGNGTEVEMVLLRDVIERKVVCITNSYNRDHIIARYPSLDLVVGDDRNGFSYVSYVMFKNHRSAKRIAKS